MIEYSLHIEKGSLRMTIKKIWEQAPNSWRSQDSFFTFYRCVGDAQGKLAGGGLTIIADNNFLPITLISPKYDDMAFFEQMIDKIQSSIDDMTAGINEYTPISIPVLPNLPNV